MVNLAYDFGRFIVTPAGKVWSFVVKTAEKALKAISGIIEWVGAELEDTVAWLAEKPDRESLIEV